MRLATCALCCCLAACAAVTPAQQPASAWRDNRISLYVGQRDLDEDDHAPVDEQGTIGLEYSHESPASPLGFELGLMGSSDDDKPGGVKVKGSTGELYGGLKLTFGDDVLRPYVGAGASWIRFKGEVAGTGSDDDGSIAGYVHGGLAVHATDQLVFGLDLRALFGSDITIFGVDTDADYEQLAVFAGFEF